MNIFVLDKDPKICAQYHTDKHVVKMILESVQMLSTALRLSGLSKGYKATHINHPCTKWVRESLSNWLWLKELTIYLHEEWQYRYNHSKKHKSIEVLEQLPNPFIHDKGLTEQAQAMPEVYKDCCVVQAYRNYYKEEKKHLFTWTKRPIPEWIK